MSMNQPLTPDQIFISILSTILLMMSVMLAVAAVTNKMDLLSRGRSHIPKEGLGRDFARVIAIIGSAVLFLSALAVLASW